VIGEWRDGETRDMLVEMRRVALLSLTGVVFGVNFAPEMDEYLYAIARRLCCCLCRCALP
jgi:hypothetical protein